MSIDKVLHALVEHTRHIFLSGFDVLYYRSMRPIAAHRQGAICAFSMRELVCPAKIDRVIYWLTPDDVIISPGTLDHENAFLSFSLPPRDKDGHISDYSRNIHCSDCPIPDGCVAVYKER